MVTEQPSLIGACELDQMLSLELPTSTIAPASVSTDQDSDMPDSDWVDVGADSLSPCPTPGRTNSMLPALSLDAHAAADGNAGDTDDGATEMDDWQVVKTATLEAVPDEEVTKLSALMVSTFLHIWQLL